MSYIGNTTQNQNYVPAVDYFNGDGSTVAFTLSRPVASVAAVQAVISNVPQNPGSAFTVSGSTITFTSAPPSGTANIYVYYTSPNTQVVQPGQGTVYPASLSTGGPYWNTAGNVGIGTSSPSGVAANYTTVDIRGSSGGAVKMGVSGGANTYMYTDSGGSNIFTSTTIPLQFGTNGTERMRIDSSGNLLVGTTSFSYNPSQGITFAAGNVGSIGINHANGTTSGNGYANFVYNTTNIGSITQNGTTGVSYNTSSDYRLKENIQPMQNALDVVAQLNPVTYTWKADGSDGQGFIAHELQAVVPDCVTGEKDAVDEEGKPVYQGIDTSFLVATLTAAIKELNAKVEAQAAEIAALKGAA